MATLASVAYPPYPPLPPPAPHRRTRGAVVTLVVGVALLVVAGVMGVGGIWLFGDAVTSAVRTGEEVRGSFDAELEPPGEVEVDLDEGVHTVYAVTPRSPVTTTTGTPGTADVEGTTSPPFADDLALEVTVTAADGTELVVDVEDVGSTWRDIAGGVDVEEVSTVRVPEAGTFTVAVAVAPGSGPVDAVGIGPEQTYGEAVSRGVGSFALVGVAFLVGGLGGVLALVGFVWLMVALTSR